MPLPILHTTTPTDPATLLRLFHKTEHLWTQHLAEETQLAAGSAFTSRELNNLAVANRVMGAALDSALSADAAIAEVNGHFAAKQVRCLAWVMNPSAPADQVQPLI